MGCASSKRFDVAAAKVYKPPPASIAYFDISSVGEPWLVTDTTDDTTTEDKQLQGEKLSKVALPILDKVDSDETPISWLEVSKVLEDFKPSLQNPSPKPLPKKQNHPKPLENCVENANSVPPKPLSLSTVKKNKSFHTIEELDSKVVTPKDKDVKRKPISPPSSPPPARALALPDGVKPVSQNSFILRDRQEREKNKNPSEFLRRLRRDPFEGLQEISPPEGAEGVVLYTTTLHGVRRTFEDCQMARQVVEGLCPISIDIDERDVSLHGDYLRELRDLLGEGITVPRLFIKGRYVGGVDEIVEFNENGKLRDMMRRMKRIGGESEVGKARKGCEGCGGARFVPCLECNGSCKVFDEEGSVVRCGECNENGLMQCPICH